MQFSAFHVGIGKLQPCGQLQSFPLIRADRVEEGGRCRVILVAEVAVQTEFLVEPLLVFALQQLALVAGNEPQVAPLSTMVE